MSSKGRFISWLDRRDLPIRVQYADGVLAEVLFLHKNPVEGWIQYAVHIRADRPASVNVYYELEVSPGEVCLLPVRDCMGYRDILCRVGVEYVSAAK